MSTLSHLERFIERQEAEEARNAKRRRVSESDDEEEEKVHSDSDSDNEEVGQPARPVSNHKRFETDSDSGEEDVHPLRAVANRLESQSTYTDEDLSGGAVTSSVVPWKTPEDDWSDTYAVETKAQMAAEQKFKEEFGEAGEEISGKLQSFPKNYCFFCEYTLDRATRQVNDKYDKLWKIILENYSKCKSRDLTKHVQTFYATQIRPYLTGRPWWRCETIWVHIHDHVYVHEIEMQRLLRVQRLMLTTVEKNELWEQDTSTGAKTVVLKKQKQWVELFKEHKLLALQVWGKQNSSLI